MDVRGQLALRQQTRKEEAAFIKYHLGWNARQEILGRGESVANNPEKILQILEGYLEMKTCYHNSSNGTSVTGSIPMRTCYHVLWAWSLYTIEFHPWIQLIMGVESPC